MSDVPTVSNVRQDLNEWQARHATLVLSAVKVLSRLTISVNGGLMHVCPWEIGFMWLDVWPVGECTYEQTHILLFCFQI